MSSVISFVNAIVKEIINPIIILLIIVGVLYFLWGMIMFISKAGDGGNKEKGEAGGRAIGKRHMTWGIVGLFIMVAVYGILQILLSTFDICGTLPAPPNC